MNPRSPEHPFRQLTQQLEPIPTGMTPNLEPLRDIRAVVFDVYGTLVISGTGDVGSADPNRHDNAMVAAAAAIGMPPLSDPTAGTQLYRELIGESHASSRNRGIDNAEVNILAIWRAWLTRMNFEDTSVPTVRRLALVFEANANASSSMPDATTTICRLKERGLALGIVSNAQFYTHDLLEIALGSTPSEVGFEPDLSYFSYRFGESKPGSIMFDRLIEALMRNGIEPRQALYVGNDMLNDVITAHRSGLRTALFAGDQRSLRTRDKESAATGVVPDIVLTSLRQLTEVLTTG